MASQQARRENVTDERKIEVEKARVPKMASHFESLADQVQGATDVHPGAVHVKSTVTTVPDQGTHQTKSRHHDQKSQPIQQAQREKQQSSDVVTQGRKQQGFEEKPGGVKFDVHGQEHKNLDTTRGTQMQKQGVGAGGQHERTTEAQARGQGENVAHHEGGGTKGPSLDEISQYRQTAQQNSMDTIRAAEERYEKAKEKGASTLQNVKESATHGLGAATEKGAQAKDTLTHSLQKAKDTALEKGQQAYEATKDNLSGAGQTAAQSAQQAKDYTMQKTGEAKDYAAPKTGEVQEQGKGAASYVGEKAAQVKDATVETGKGAVGYAGKVAGAVKDTAVVAGLGAAHLTAKAAAEATKATASAVSTVAGYAGEKTVAAKDLVADAGKKTAGYAGDKLAAAKDYVVSAEESAAEYAARKKAEAEREIEARKSQDTTKGESRGGDVSGETRESKVEGKESGFQPKKVEETFQEETGGGKESKQPEEGAAVVLHAIGETIMEIGKTTTDLVAGPRGSQTGDEPAVVTKKESTTIKKA
ncbi:seed biotin-containing protein SBP65-like isoform X1 [Lycium barbarum]|uniref:seed biotin-containing protein SBP65-like isoform X1 n=1 Tax=Lycium barbarum TaxID=112863 RepID=UPI00293E2A48|nr:seed biotin-containing protein SBP65-like isoform X1 [Lycium barbarum]